MGILAECPICRKKQGTKNRVCKCGEDLIKAKKAQRVKYWISYDLPNGKQRRESVGAMEGLKGYSIEDAQIALAKRRVQKKENRVFDMLPESRMPFDELTQWYLGLTAVRKLSSYDRVGLALRNFNAVFGHCMVNDIKQTDLEEYQDKRKQEGRADATVDMEIKIAQTAVTKAFDNDILDGHCLKAFRKTKRLLDKGSNARKATVSLEQYLTLLDHASPHYRAVLTIAFNTGMRLGEIRQLKWSYIDRKSDMIRLPAEVVKEGKDKDIPINHHVKDALDSLPRALQHDFAVTYRGTPLANKNSLKKQFSATCEKAGILYGRNVPGGITFHDIRRTFKTSMLQAGVDKIYRDAIVGHSLKGMDAHYIVTTDETLTDAMNKFTEWLDGHLEKANSDQNSDQKQIEDRS